MRQTHQKLTEKQSIFTPSINTQIDLGLDLDRIMFDSVDTRDGGYLYKSSKQTKVLVCWVGYGHFAAVA